MENQIIPKNIHYCWFGKKDKPLIVNKCIDSWKRNLSDYKIIEWNENNFDINCNRYVKEAYDKKKYAFVSDYVRVYVLYNYGGIYLDTDVEVFKSFDDLLENDSFWGFEEKNYIATSTIGARRGNKLIKEFLDEYTNRKFVGKNGELNTITNVVVISDIIKNKGIDMNGEYQKIKGIGAFYPQEYFSPYDYINCYSKKNTNTYAIHYFYKSWLPISSKIKATIKSVMSKIIGGENMNRIRNKIR